MRAVRQHAAGGPLAVEEIPAPVPGAGETLVTIAAGAVISIFSVTLVTMYGQTRILFSMGRDGMLPKRFAQVNPRTRTPVFNTVVVAVVVDDAARGHGVGEKLNRFALDIARQKGAKTVDLPSRPSREAANRLYQRIGFLPRDTNVYRYDL